MIDVQGDVGITSLRKSSLVVFCTLARGLGGTPQRPSRRLHRQPAPTCRRPGAGEIEGSGVPALRPSHREELLGFRVLHRTYADVRQGRCRVFHYCLTSN